MATVKTAPPQPEHIRLHITPFNAELYDRIIPPSLQPLARNASFHSIQTFPEKGYGFVELPTMDAQKLKKKLNGSTLKGTKMSVEEARPARKRKSDAGPEEAESERKRAKRERKEGKAKEDGVLAGHELEEGRRVKRGWSGDDAKGKNRKERGFSGSEERSLRFKTKLPANRVSVENGREKKKKDKKSKKGTDKGEVVVEEFTRRRKSRQDVSTPNGATLGSLSYVEGKGWVDEAGTVVEPERESKKPKKRRSSSPESMPVPGDHRAIAGAEIEPINVPLEDSALPSERPEDFAAADSSSDKSEQALHVDTPAEISKDVHPLEALFKRPAAPTKDGPSNTTPSKPRPAPIDTSFSFFGTGGGDEDEDTEMQGADNTGGNAMPPVTPHTKQDLEWRSLRSAAPTPDTAAIGRKFSFPFAGDDVDEEDEEDEDERMGDGEDVDRREGNSVEKGQGDNGGGEESAFRKWFFEHRGDLNRGWKKRRREERKVLRQRENRRLGRKVA